MSRLQATPGGRYWLLGGRWVEGGKYLPWPRVYGPYGDRATALASAEALNAVNDPRVRYLVVADAPEEMA